MIIAALDFEATGLINPDVPIEYQPAIMEIGAVRYDGKKMREYSQLVNPGKPIPEEVQKITNITPGMVKDAPTFRVAFKEFSEFMTGVDKLVTFNGPGYDLPVLMLNLQRLNLQYQFPWPRYHLDLMPASSDFLGMKGKTGNKNPKLTELYEALFGEPFPDAHRAVEDAKATIKCAWELSKKGIIQL